MKKGSLRLLFPAALIALAVVGGTWAEWTQRVQAGNEYQIGKYSTRLVEEFTPPDNWQPGVDVQKAIWVTNDSPKANGVPVLAKVEISQSWIRQENVYAETIEDGTVTQVPIEPLAGEPLPLIFQPEGESGRQFAAKINFNPDGVVALESQRNKEAGLRLDIPSVSSFEEAGGKWILAEETPNLTGNYVFYYVGVLQPGESSPHLVESVTMNPVLESTVTGSHTQYVKREDGYHKVTMETVNSAYGYDSCRYTMDVKATTVQNTQAAVDKVFGSNSIDQKVVSYLEQYVADEGVFESDLTKKLSFSLNNGRMEYTPYRNGEGVEEGNWFMSFTDMVPGGIYRDKLVIENQSGWDHRIFMRVLPRAQDSLRDEILNMISMKVWLDGSLLYDGTAMGSSVEYLDSLQRMVYLGRYKPNTARTITVELQLDPELALDETGTCKYADILSKIDWEFWASEIPGEGRQKSDGTIPGVTPRTIIGDEPVPLSTIDDGGVPLSDGSLIIEDEAVPLAAVPKTGDTTPWIPLIVTFLVSGSFLAGLVIVKRKERN